MLLLFRDLVRKLLVQDRTKRLGNMKVRECVYIDAQSCNLTNMLSLLS